MGELVLARREGGVAVLTLHRPEKLNALSTALEMELADALASDDVSTSNAIVVEGSGRAFSAGADVTELREQRPADILAYYRTTGEVYEWFATLRQPTIAAIHGYCLGGGFELALGCDLRVADETAVFGLPEVAIGIVPSSGGLHRLVRAVGPARAKELILARPRIDAPEALRLGVVSEVVPEGIATERALELGSGIAALPPLAVEVAKRAIDAAAESSRDAAILIERLAYAALAQTPEHAGATGDFGKKND
jgi:enoyl-CoA hydratase/carnithine racemase